MQAALAYAVAHLFERDSAVHEKELLAEALRHGAGRIFAEQVRQAVRRGEHGILSATIEGQPMVTTRQVLAEEKAMLAWAARTKRPEQCVQPLGRPGQGRFRSDWLNEGQQAAVRYVLESRHRLMMIRGGAGKGKSTLMQEAAKEIEAQSGKQIFAFAPGTKARDVLRKEGFKDAQTVAHLFHNEVLQHRLRGNVLWIDEAGQMGVQDMNKVFALAEATGCRLLLSGDAGQHGSIPRGDAMRLLQDKAGIQGPVLTEILRQQGAYKDAVTAIEHGRIEEGFRSFDALGWVVEAPEEVRHTLIAEDYAWYTRAGDTVLAVAPTHAEGRKVTAAIRAELRKEGRLGQAEHSIVSLRNLQWTEAEKSQAASYRPGMMVQFVQNAKGIKDSSRNKVSISSVRSTFRSGVSMRQNRIIPVPMERRSFDLQGRHLGITDFDTSGIRPSVQRCLDTQALRCRSGANEAHDHLPTLQRLATPVGGDVAEHAVLNLVPLARARGQMADTDAQTARIGETLQFPLPQPRAGAVTAAAVGGDQQLLGLRIHRCPHLEPPGPDRRHREGGRVMVHADAHPADVGVQVIDPIRNGLAQCGVDKIVDADLGRLALGVPLLPSVFEVADQLLLLRVDRDDRLAPVLKVAHTGGDVLKLGVAIRVLGAFARLACSLQAVTGRVEQLTDQLRTDLVPLGLQLGGEAPHTLAGPAQRRLGIAAGRRLHQGLQVPEQRRVLGRSPLAPGPRPPHPRRLGDRCSAGVLLHLTNARADGLAGQACGASHSADATVTERPCFCRRPTPPGQLVQHGTEGLELLG